MSYKSIAFPFRNGRINEILFAALCLIYFLSITLLRPTHWLDLGYQFTPMMSLMWAAVPLITGFIINKPAYITTGLLLACMTPSHTTSWIAAIATIIYVCGNVFWQNRNGYRALLRHAFKSRGLAIALLPIAYMFTVWLIRLGDSTDAWSFFALSLSLFLVPYTVYCLSYLSWSREDIALAMRFGVIALGAMGLTVLVYPLIAGVPEQYPQAVYVIYKSLQSVNIDFFSMEWINPDYNRASLGNSHIFSAIMLPLCFGFYAMARLKKQRAWIYASIAALYLFLMGENAHIFAGFVLAIACVILIPALIKKTKPVVIALSILVLVLCVNLGLIAWFYGPTGYFRNAPKAIMYSLSLQHVIDHPGRMILGEGPAAFSSNAGRKRIDPNLRFEGDIPLFSQFTNPYYETALKKAHVPGIPSTINRPFSGLLGLFMEWGLIGSLIVGYVFFFLVEKALICWRSVDPPAIKAAALAAIALFICFAQALVFRPYFEYPDGMIALALLFFVVLLRPEKEGESVAVEGRCK